MVTSRLGSLKVGATAVAFAALAVGMVGCTAEPASTPAPDVQQEYVAPQAEETTPAAETAAAAETAPAAETTDPQPAEAEEATPDSIVGLWSASDGSGVKIVNSDGSCSGMYYNNGKPLDIGGPMSCVLGSEQRSNGSYLLVVTQSPNQASYEVTFSGDTFTLASGDQLITMTRQ